MGLASGEVVIARAMFAYALGLAAIATLSPFDFQAIPGRSFATLWLLDDGLRNLMLLAPAGFLGALAWRAPLAVVLVCGFAVSALLETGQLFLPSRHANLVDIVTNGLGAFTGAYVARRLAARVRATLSKERLLELPLTGALYVLAPLVVLHGLTATSAVRGYALLPLGPFAGTIAAALYVRRIEPLHLTGLGRFAAGIGLFTALSALPAGLGRLTEVVLLGLGAALTTLAFSLLAREPAGEARRFEEPTVRRALPWYALYLACVALVGAPGATQGAGGNLRALALLHVCAATTVLGYLLRAALSRRERGVLVAASVAACAGGLLALRLERPALDLASVLRLGLVLGAGGAGAALHGAQVRLVRSLRA